MTGESQGGPGREGGGVYWGEIRPSDGGREGFIPDKIIPDFVQGPVGHSTCEIFKESNHITTVCSLGNADGLKICLNEEYLDLYLNLVKMYTNFQHLLS